MVHILAILFCGSVLDTAALSKWMLQLESDLFTLALLVFIDFVLEENSAIGCEQFCGQD